MYVVSNLTLADYARLAILTVFSDVFWVVLNHSKLVFFFDLYCSDSTCCDSVSKFDEVRVNMLWRVGVDTKRLFTSTCNVHSTKCRFSKRRRKHTTILQIVDSSETSTKRTTFVASTSTACRIDVRYILLYLQLTFCISIHMYCPELKFTMRVET